MWDWLTRKARKLFGSWQEITDPGLNFFAVVTKIRRLTCSYGRKISGTILHVPIPTIWDPLFRPLYHVLELPRQPGKIAYPLTDCYLSVFALFVLQDPSLLEFQRRFQDQVQQNNLTTIFGVDEIPSDSQLRDVIDTHEYAAITDVYRRWFAKLQRSKKLERYQVLGGYYLVTLDRSEYFTSEHVHCDRCLKRKKAKGRSEYYHQILQPALIRPGLSEVIPFAPEFIRVQDGATKQDYEINAGLRAIKRVRADHRQLSAVVLGDELYATERFITALGDRDFSYLLGVKEGSHRKLFQDIEGLRRGGSRLPRAGVSHRRDGGYVRRASL